MVLSHSVIESGYRVIINAVGCNKKDLTIKAKSNGMVIVELPERDYASKDSLELQFYPETYNVKKTVASLENGILILEVPYGKDGKDSNIDIN